MRPFFLIGTIALIVVLTLGAYFYARTNGTKTNENGETYDNANGPITEEFAITGAVIEVTASLLKISADDGAQWSIDLTPQMVVFDRFGNRVSVPGILPGFVIRAEGVQTGETSLTANLVQIVEMLGPES